MDNSSQPGNNSNEAESIFALDEFPSAATNKHIRQARNAIFAVAVLLVINLIVLSFSVPASYEYLWIDILLWSCFVAGFVALGFWANKKPYYAIVSALLLYIFFIALNAYFDISSLAKGIIFKTIMIVYLVKGINDAREAQRLQATFSATQ